MVSSPKYFEIPLATPPTIASSLSLNSLFISTKSADAGNNAHNAMYAKMVIELKDVENPLKNKNHFKE